MNQQSLEQNIENTSFFTNLRAEMMKGKTKKALLTYQTTNKENPNFWQ